MPTRCSDGRRLWQARPERSLEFAVDVDGGVRRPPATSVARREAVAVEIEAEPRSCPHVHQRQFPLGLPPCEHAQGQRHLGATGDLVHLVDVLALEMGQLVTMLEAERPVAAGEMMVERWLGAPGYREIGGEGFLAMPHRQPVHRCHEEQGRETLGRTQCGQSQQLRVVGQTLEKRRRELPRR